MLIGTRSKMSQSRKIFTNQPAFHLIIDLCHPMSMDLLQLITQTLRNVLVLSTHMRGSPRIPYFAMSVLSFKFENIVPLQQLKDNAGNILKSIVDFTNSNKKLCGCTLSQPDFYRLFSEGVKKIIQDFQSNDPSKRAVGKTAFPSDLHVSFLTTNETFCRSSMDSLFALLSATRTTKLQVIELIPPGFERAEEITNHASNTRFIEFLKVTTDSLSLEDYFKTWLEDSTKSKEHIRIKFLKDDTPTLVINCDLAEHMVNPLEIPHSQQFLLRTDSTFTVKNFEKVPVYDLTVVGRIPVAKLNDADCFGWSLLLKPTQCWNFRWQENVENQQLFLSINQFLQTQNEVLLCQKKPESNLPAGYFVIRPVETGMAMSLKAIVPQELMLSGFAPKKDLSLEPTLGIIKHTVNSEMKRTKFIHDFSPKQHCHSGFYDAVTKTLVNFTDQDGVFVFPNPKNCKPSGKVSRGTEKTPLKRPFGFRADLNERSRTKTNVGSPKLSQSTINYPRINPTRLTENNAGLLNIRPAVVSQSLIGGFSFQTPTYTKAHPTNVNLKPSSNDRGSLIVKNVASINSPARSLSEIKDKIPTEEKAPSKSDNAIRTTNSNSKLSPKTRNETEQSVDEDSDATLFDGPLSVESDKQFNTGFSNGQTFSEMDWSNGLKESNINSNRTPLSKINLESLSLGLDSSFSSQKAQGRVDNGEPVHGWSNGPSCNGTPLSTLNLDSLGPDSSFSSQTVPGRVDNGIDWSNRAQEFNSNRTPLSTLNLNSLSLGLASSFSNPQTVQCSNGMSDFNARFNGFAIKDKSPHLDWSNRKKEFNSNGPSSSMLNIDSFSLGPHSNVSNSQMVRGMSNFNELLNGMNINGNTSTHLKTFSTKPSASLSSGLECSNAASNGSAISARPDASFSNGQMAHGLEWSNAASNGSAISARPDASFSNGQMAHGLEWSNAASNGKAISARPDASFSNGQMAHGLEWSNAASNGSAMSGNNTADILETLDQMAHGLEWSNSVSNGSAISGNNPLSTRPDTSSSNFPMVQWSSAASNGSAIAVQQDGSFDSSFSNGMVQWSNSTNETSARLNSSPMNCAKPLREGRFDSTLPGGQMAEFEREWSNVLPEEQNERNLSIERRMELENRVNELNSLSIGGATNGNFDRNVFSTSFGKKNERGTVIKPKLKPEPKKKVQRTLKQLKLHMYFDKN